MTVSYDYVNLFGDNGLNKHLGNKFTLVTPSKIISEMEVTESHLQPAGLLHGGVSVSLAESAGSLGSFVAYLSANNITNMKDITESWVGLEINANHIQSMKAGDIAVCTATPIYSGRRTQVWSMEIRRKSDNKLCCISRMTTSSVKLVKAAPKL